MPSQTRLQIIVVLVALVLWVAAVVLALLDGDEVLKIVTPIVTMAFGWLFAVKAGLE